MSQPFEKYFYSRCYFKFTFSTHAYSHVLKEKQESTVGLSGRVWGGIRVQLNIWEKYGRELEYGHTFS